MQHYKLPTLGTFRPANFQALELGAACVSPPGTAIIWHYRAIYLRGDTRVGQWSNVVSAAVSG